MSLPIYTIVDQIKSSLSQRHELVIEAPPGAGKTTVVPLALLNEPWLKNQHIFILQPRRMATRAVAERMAQTLGEPVGQTVGYRIRQEKKISDATRIVVMTEGILTRQLQKDPSLEGVGLVIFDEFHERHIESDLALTLCQDSRSVFREEDPLKILVMSATLEGISIATHLNKAPTVKCEGKQHHVDIHYATKMPEQRDISEAVTQTTLKALKAHGGNLLVFLPGQKEIRQVQTKLDSVVDQQTLIAPLFGGLSPTEQKQAIEPLTYTSEHLRKIVLATDIAETSLTIEGITVVVDSGLCRVPEYDTNTGLTRLKTQWLSKASSTQRAGRAGRLGPGHCYRLWTQAHQHTLAAQRAAEILQADMVPVAMQLINWGAQNPTSLPWLDPPPQNSYQQALDVLASLGAVEQRKEDWQISAHGRKIVELPVHPRLGHMLIRAAEEGALELACQMAGLLAERDGLSRLGADFYERLLIVSGKTNCPQTHKSWKQRCLKQSTAFFHVAKKHQKKGDTQAAGDKNTIAARLLCYAYPERIAQRMSNEGRYKLSNGRSAFLPPGDRLINTQWLIVVDIGGKKGERHDRIFLALALPEELFEDDLAHLITQHETAQWNVESGKFIAQTNYKIGQLTWKSETRKTTDKRLITEALIRFIKVKGLSCLSWSKQVRQWQARVALVGKYHNDSSWPDVSDTALLANLETWLAPFLDEVETLEQLRKLDLEKILQSVLDWSQTQTLDTLAPKSMTIPSGATVGIDYLSNPPVLAVKLQEMFGCTQTPRVLQNTIPLMIHLLSPAKRPVQITQDLAGFWNSGYESVKKELKGRYPKHPWPDNPITAQPTSATKRQLIDKS